jgi:hypothetical protein
MGKITAVLTSLLALLTAVPWPLAAQESSPNSKDNRPSYQSDNKGIKIVDKKGNDGYRWAITIGINDYWDSKVTDLKKARNDAKALGDTFINNGQFNKVFIMTDDLSERDSNFPKKRNIEDNVKYIADMANPNDLVVFHFSGHGLSNENGESYLIPADVSLNDPFATSIKLDDMVKKLRGAGIKKILLMIDACREELSSTKSITNRSLNQKIYTEAEVAAVFYATKQGWFSYEDPNSNYGIFTRFVVQGLKGNADKDNDGIVSFSELDLYVTNEIFEYAAKINYKQKPFTKLYGEKFGDLALSIGKYKGSEEVEANVDTQTGIKVLVSDSKHYVSYQIVNDNIIFFMRSIQEGPMITVDVNQNGIIDKYLDRSYGERGNGSICAQYLIDSKSWTTCGGAMSSSTLYRSNSNYTFTIPLSELKSSKSATSISVYFTFWSSSNGLTIYPQNGKNFSQMFIINIK